MPITSKPDLILGAAVGYRWAQIAPFVRSLRGTGCKAEVVLLVGQPDPELRLHLDAHGIRTIAIQHVVHRIPDRYARKRFNRRWLGWLHRRLPRWLAGPAPKDGLRLACMATAASWFHRTMCSRYLLLYRFLRTRSDLYGLVLNTDVRDVVFQADPFADPWRPETGSVFLEHDATHGNEHYNDSWIRTGFDEAGLELLRGRRITCAGTTLAPAALMRAYLASMTREIGLRTERFAGLEGVDQGVHNWLYWTGRLPDFQPQENFNGPILTMHGLPPELIQQDAAGRVIDHQSRVIPVLHQYDRHPALQAQVFARWGAEVQVQPG